MSSKRRKWKFRLRHINEAINRISGYIWGMNFEQFKADPKTVDAVIRNFLIIGEAAHHILQVIEYLSWQSGGQEQDSYLLVVAADENPLAPFT